MCFTVVTPEVTLPHWKLQTTVNLRPLSNKDDLKQMIMLVLKNMNGWKKVSAVNKKPGATSGGARGGMFVQIC